MKSLDFAMRNFKDESFVAQYLSPKLMRDMKLFAVLDSDARDKLEVTAIHEEKGYRYLRQALADQYNLGSREPDIQVYDVDRGGDRSLTLRHVQYHRRPLGETLDEVMKHVAHLWGFQGQDGKRVRGQPGRSDARDPLREAQAGQALRAGAPRIALHPGYMDAGMRRDKAGYKSRPIRRCANGHSPVMLPKIPWIIRRWVAVRC